MKTKLIRLRIKLPIKPALTCFATFLITTYPLDTSHRG
jgi:hypothetical protein